MSAAVLIGNECVCVCMYTTYDAALNVQSNALLHQCLPVFVTCAAVYALVYKLWLVLYF